MMYTLTKQIIYHYVSLFYICSHEIIRAYTLITNTLVDSYAMTELDGFFNDLICGCVTD